MSDPVTNVEIEDVLSSIRKLVSDDPRPSEKGVSASSAAPDRLVLTPDFRVQDDDLDQDEAESVEDLVDHAEEVSDDDLTDSENGAAPSEETDSLFEEADAFFEDDHTTIQDHAPVEEAASEDDTPDAPMFEDVPVDPLEAEVVEMGSAPAADPLESRIAELEAAVAQQEESWDPDGLDDSDENTPSALSSSVADIWETVEPEEIPVSAPASDSVLEAEEEPEDAPSDIDVQADDDVFEGFATEDDARLDEEALREMVSELVRQELQGALGARITRNVRKLVRREIHRIVGSKDFD
ncbi:MAG: hypothetical protein AAGK92_13510 [Pseudomonadota bacterium]